MNINDFAVFDHTDKALRQSALELGIPYIDPIDKLLEDKERNAARELLMKVPKILLVHISPEGWEHLLEHADQEQVLVRFTTEGYPPSPFEKAKNGALVLRLRLAAHELRMKSTDGPSDLESLFESLSRPEVIELLRSNLIPEALRRYFQFTVPHYFRAIFLLCLGYLVIRIEDKLDWDERTSKRLMMTARKFRIQDLTPTHSLELSKQLRSKANWQTALGTENKDFDAKIQRDFYLAGQSSDEVLASFLRELRSPSDVDRKFDLAVLNILDFVSERL